MNHTTDLRTTRVHRGLTLEDLASLAGLRSATIQEVEVGKRLPRHSTQAKVELIVGKIDWLRSFSSGKEGITYFLQEFINPTAPGMGNRVRIARQTLKAIGSLNT